MKKIVKKTVKKATKKDIPSLFDMKTGVDVGKSKKTMPKKSTSAAAPKGMHMMSGGMAMPDAEMKKMQKKKMGSLSNLKSAMKGKY